MNNNIRLTCMFIILVISIPQQIVAQWQLLTPLGGGQGVLADSANIYAVSEGGVFLSTDDGVDWIPRKSGLFDENILSLYANNGIIYVGMQDGGVFCSTDTGAVWFQ